MKPINQYCPRSGKAVIPEALTVYKGFTVGFCNTGCRDDFAQNNKNNPNDCFYFDVLIKENKGAK